MIMRGTTPYHSFILPLRAEQVSHFCVSYTQNGTLILDKQDADMDITNIEDLYENASMEELTDEEKQSSQVVLHLTQEDTLKFKFYPAAEKNIAVIQVRILTDEGEAYASDPVTERVMGVIKDGVIGGNNEITDTYGN